MNINTVLLAGGESRRMGRDKPTLLFRGAPLWKIQFSLLRKLNAKKIFLSARADPSWRPTDVEFVPDEAPSRGPISGIAATLDRIESGHLLVLAVDLPFMNENHLRFLGQRVAPGRGVLPTIGQRAEPLAAIYPVEALPSFTAALSGRDFSMQTLTEHLSEMGQLSVVPVPANEERSYLNLNQPSDLTD